MTILNRVEAALVVRVENTDERLFDLLPQVDEYIKRATGVDWASIDPVPVAAKSAARMLLVKWYEDPGSIGASGEATLGFGLSNTLMQLKAEALKYVIVEGLDGGGYIQASKARLGDEIVSVTGILGASGDQSAAFADYVEYEGLIEQVSTEDLSEMWFRVKLKPLEDQ